MRRLEQSRLTRRWFSRALTGVSGLVDAICAIDILLNEGAELDDTTTVDTYIAALAIVNTGVNGPDKEGGGVTGRGSFYLEVYLEAINGSPSERRSGTTLLTKVLTG